MIGCLFFKTVGVWIVEIHRRPFIKIRLDIMEQKIINSLVRPDACILHTLQLSFKKMIDTLVVYLRMVLQFYVVHYVIVLHGFF